MIIHHVLSKEIKEKYLPLIIKRHPPGRAMGLGEILHVCKGLLSFH